MWINLPTQKKNTVTMIWWQNSATKIKMNTILILSCVLSWLLVVKSRKWLILWYTQPANCINRSRRAQYARYTNGQCEIWKLSHTFKSMANFHTCLLMGQPLAKCGYVWVCVCDKFSNAIQVCSVVLGCCVPYGKLPHA